MKLIYLAKRKPGFTPDDFTRRWRMHGAVGMSTVFWRHALCYVQAEPIRPPPVAGASDAYDAIVYMIVKDDAFAGPFSPEDVAANETMLADELKTFAEPIPNVSMWVDEHRLKDGEPGGVTAFLFFKDEEKARQMAEPCRNLAEANRVILNVKPGTASAGAMPSTLPYAAVVEISAGSVVALKRLAAGAEAGPAFQAADVAVVTREAVLWDRITPAA